MAEIWGAAIAAVGGIASGAAASKKSKQDKADAKAATAAEAGYGALSEKFGAQLTDYYSQTNRQRKERGLDQFRKFSTVASYAPEFVDEHRIQVGDMPSLAEFMKQAKAIDTMTKAPPKKKKGLFEKLAGFTPWDQAIGKATDGLFGTDANKANANAASNYTAEQAAALAALGG